MHFDSRHMDVADIEICFIVFFFFWEFGSHMSEKFGSCENFNSKICASKIMDVKCS